MRRIALILAVAAISSGATAAAIVVPARADDAQRGRREHLEQFQACMDRHGFEIGPATVVLATPDGITVNGKRVDDEAFRDAQRDCGPLVPSPRDLGLGELRDARRLGRADRHLEQLRRCLDFER
jgi:hypothetical protein